MTGCSDTGCFARSKTGLFNDAFSTACYAVSNDRMIVHDERENMWKEKTVVYFKVIYQLDELRKIMKKLKAGI
jgi:hypothetical protein